MILAPLTLVKEYIHMRGNETKLYGEDSFLDWGSQSCYWQAKGPRVGG